MKMRIAGIAVLMYVVSVSLFGTVRSEDGCPTVFIVRHAEKDQSIANASDPPLSDRGRARAAQLAHVLKDAGIATIYVTPFARSRQTAEPLAAQNGLTPQSYDAMEFGKLITSIRSHNPDQSVLVVAHSNTVAEIVDKLSGQRVAPIAEDEYDHLYVITHITRDESKAKVVHLRYGTAH